MVTRDQALKKSIQQILDFSRPSGRRRSLFEAEFHIQVAKRKRIPLLREPFPHVRLSESGDALSSLWGDPVVRMSIDSKRNVIKATIDDPEGTYCENLIDFVVMRPLRYLLGRAGFFYLHAATVSRGQECLVISGVHNSGKSTTAVTLARAGYRLLADDDCFVRCTQKGNGVIPFPTKIGLNDGILRGYPDLRSRLVKGYRYCGKQRFSFSDNFDSSSAGVPYACRAILFPVYDRSADRAYLKLMPQKKALDKLMKDQANFFTGLNDSKLHQERFWAMYRFSHTVNAYELHYHEGKLAEVPAVVGQIFT